MNFNNISEIYEIAKILNKNNYEFYLVGGALRDILMNREPTDFDFTTNASPDAIIKLFPKNFQTGIKHGTISIIFNRKVFEITTYRIDKGYENKRHPNKVEFIKDINKDLERRDFTINSIAFDPLKDEILDIYNGKLDIKRKIIKCIGNPIERFEEDALRILRAARFSSTLDFNIERNTFFAMKYKANNLDLLSKERIQTEFVKLIRGTNPEKGLLYLNKINFFQKFFKVKINNKTIKKLKYLSQDNFYLKAIVVLTLEQTQFELKESLKNLKFSNKDIKNIIFLKKIIDINLISEINNLKMIRFFLSQATKEYYLDIIDINKALKINKRNIKYIEKNINKKDVIEAPLKIQDLDINGHDIENLNKIEEKNIGKALNFLLEEVIINPKLNHKQILIEKIKKNLFCKIFKSNLC